MHKAAKTITGENFPVFKKLMEEVIVKATGKSISNNPAISDVVSKTTGDIIQYIPEIKAREIMTKITDNALDNANKGRRLQALINAALNNDNSINARVYTLDSLAEYVLKNGKEVLTKNVDSISLPNWSSYLEKYKHLLVQYNSNTNSTPEEAIIISEVDGTAESHFDETASILESENGTPEIHESLNRHAFENSEINTIPANKTDRKKFIHDGMRGGIYSGIAASIIIALVRYMNGKNITPFSTGYENMNFDKFMQYVFTPLLLFQMLAGALLGWLCCYTATAKRKLANNMLLFIISFIVIVVLRQSMARDAWYIRGTYPNHTEFGNITMGGGLFGEPDFETLATGLMGAFVILLLVQAFRKNKFAALATKDTFGLIMKTIIYGTLTWCLVYGIYILLTVRLKIMDTGDYLFAPSFFKVEFPHPERPIFAICLYLIYVFCILISIQYYAYKKESIALDFE